MPLRETNWLQIIIAADPDYHRANQLQPEYEFTSHTKPFRLFEGEYQSRGAYGNRVVENSMAYFDDAYDVYADENGNQYLDQDVG